MFRDRPPWGRIRSRPYLHKVVRKGTDENHIEEALKKAQNLNREGKTVLIDVNANIEGRRFKFSISNQPSLSSNNFKIQLFLLAGEPTICMNVFLRNNLNIVKINYGILTTPIC